MTPSIGLLPLLVLSLLLAASALLWAALVWRRLRHQQRQLDALQQQQAQGLRLVNSSSVGMGRKLLELEQRLQQVPPPTADSDAAGTLTEPVDDSLRDAAALLAAGVSADEVARRCGISRAEAALMQLLNSHVRDADRQD